MRVRVCVCVCVREREREREILAAAKKISPRAFACVTSEHNPRVPLSRVYAPPSTSAAASESVNAVRYLYPQQVHGLQV